MTFPTWSVGEVLTAADMNKIGQYVSYPRNLLYNGAMQVAQRNNSLGSLTTPGFYTADRWRTDLGTLGTWTNSIENDAPTGSGFRKSAKWLCTTADASLGASDVATVQQLLEGQDLQSICKGTSSAQQLTVSFWVKSNVTGTYVFEMYDVDNTRQVSKSYTISASGTWEFKTITIPADATGAFDNDNGLSLYVLWWLGAGSTFTSGTLNTSWATVTNANRAVGQVNVGAAINNYWQITGVQLNVGQYAEPFQFKSYGQELYECQRYYYLLGQGLNAWVAPGYNFSATQANFVIKFPQEMRGTPTIDTTTGTNYYCFDRNGAGDYFDSVFLYQPSVYGCLLYNHLQIAGTAGDGGGLFIANASGKIAFSAELA